LPIVLLARGTARFDMLLARGTARFDMLLARGTARFDMLLARGTARFDPPASRSRYGLPHAPRSPIQRTSLRQTSRRSS
jgi:hypothetical protein